MWFLVLYGFNLLIGTVFIGLLGILFWNGLFRIILIGILNLLVLLINLFPIIVGALIIGISGLISIILVALSGGLINYAEAFNAVSQVVSMIFNSIGTVLVEILLMLPIFLLYVGAYFIVLVMALITLYYTRARGFPARVLEIETSIEGLSKPAKITYEGIIRIKEMVWK